LYFEVVRFDTGMITHSLMDDTCFFSDNLTGEKCSLMSIGIIAVCIFLSNYE